MSNPATYQLYRWNKSLSRQVILDRLYGTGLNALHTEQVMALPVLVRELLYTPISSFGSVWIKTEPLHFWVDLANLEEIKGPARHRRHHKRKAKTHALTT